VETLLDDDHELKMSVEQAEAYFDDIPHSISAVQPEHSLRLLTNFRKEILGIMDWPLQHPPGQVELEAVRDGSYKAHFGMRTPRQLDLSSSIHHRENSLEAILRSAVPRQAVSTT
jgi:hypothetical protein